MEIFISWSGPKSGAVAEALRNWLPKVVNAFSPWLSSADIDKGARWGSDLAGRLASARAGIICLTPSNIQSPWILFEAGALSKTLENTFVCTLLIGLEPADVDWPLAQFQATRATKRDVLKLLKTLNTGLRESSLPDRHIEDAFEVWWPRLEAELEHLPPEAAVTRPRRTDRDLIEELVDLVRNQSRVSGVLSAALRLTEKQQATAFEVLRVLKSVNADVGGLRMDSPDFRYTAEDRHGKEFTFTVPGDVPAGEIDACVRPQIARWFHQADNDVRPPRKKKRSKKRA